MLVVDAHALRLVYLLDLIHHVALQFVFAPDMQNVVRVERTADQCVSRLDQVVVLHQDAGGDGDNVLPLFHILPDDGNQTGA